MMCSEDDPPRHDHRVKFIASQVDNTKTQWRDLRSLVSDSSSKAKDFHNKNGALLEILSEEENSQADVPIKQY